MCGGVAKMLRVLWASAVSCLLGGAACAIDKPEPVSDDDFLTVEQDWVAVGQLLFFDPLLSGNKNIACSTCHHPTLGTSDGMSLSIGEGGIGLGPSRIVDAANAPHNRIPRNAPALFNRGALEFKALFHDGRVEEDDAAAFGVRMPDGRALERSAGSPLGAQNILPVLSPDEMAGHPGENEVADAVAEGRIRGKDGAWDILASRVNATAGYRDLFDNLIGPRDVHITDIAKALSQFIAAEFRATGALFDQYLAGEVLLPDDAMRGAALFYGNAGCASCHSGALLTDQHFHGVAMPQFGPGKEEGETFFRDVGRFAVTGDPADKYKFRTPSLRNVGLTAPYGHTGAFATLRDIVRHKANPKKSLMTYGLTQAALHADLAPLRIDDAALRSSTDLEGILAANELDATSLNEAQIDDIVAFLQTLTDPVSLEGRLGIPDSVPSGLPLDQ